MSRAHGFSFRSMIDDRFDSLSTVFNVFSRQLLASSFSLIASQLLPRFTPCFNSCSNVDLDLKIMIKNNDKEEG